MNEAHEFCGSDEWRQMIRDVILPWALGGTDLGDDVLEVGPGYGATTDMLSRTVPKLTSVEIDDENGRFPGAACFTMLHHVAPVERQDRLFSEIARVLRPGAPLVASDSLGSDDLAVAHEGDTYNPVDPASLATRLAAAGFTKVDVRTNDYGWAAVAVKAPTG